MDRPVFAVPTLPVCNRDRIFLIQGVDRPAKVLHNQRLRPKKGGVSAHMEVARVVRAMDSGPKTDLFLHWQVAGGVVGTSWEY